MNRAAISKKKRQQVKAKFGGRCAYCGQMPSKLTIDHLHPVARAHQLKKNVNDIDNLLPACFSCNNYKATFDLEQFRRELQRQVHRARQHSVNFRLAERFGLIETKESPVVFYFERQQT